MSPLERGILAAVALLSGAVLIYGAALVDNVFIGGGGLDGPCVTHLRSADEGTGVRTSDRSYFPPKTICVIREPSGSAPRTVVHEWPWLPVAVIGCVVVALVAPAFSLATARRT